MSTSPSAPPLLNCQDSLYADFDGTLVDIAEHPEMVTISDRLVPVLELVQQHLGGAVAIITGRHLDSLDRHLPLRLPGAGLHGAQLRHPFAAPVQGGVDPELAAVARALRDRIGDDSRLVLEDKGSSLSLHFRRAPERAQDCQRWLRELAEPLGYEVHDGKMVVEARPAGVNKGQALHELQQQAPFAGRRPIFIGDDVTDEDGFVAAAALGGHGIKVGAGDSAAAYHLPDVAAVHDWLHRSLDELNQEST